MLLSVPVMLRATQLLLVSISVAVLAGCSPTEGCTLLGCASSLLVTLRPAGGQFAEGDYAIHVKTGESASCTVELEAGGSCTGGLCPPQNGCSDQMLATVSESPQEIRLQLLERRDQVEVEILRSGVEVTTATLTPDYVQVQPNGPGCEPICDQASEEILVP